MRTIDTYGLYTQRRSAPKRVAPARRPPKPHIPEILAVVTAADEELVDGVALAKAEVVLAVDPRAKVGEAGFILADGATAESKIPTGDVLASKVAEADEVATADVGSMDVTAELTPRIIVPEGISVTAEVEVAFRAACAIAIRLFARS